MNLSKIYIGYYPYEHNSNEIRKLELIFRRYLEDIINLLSIMTIRLLGSTLYTHA